MCCSTSGSSLTVSDDMVCPSVRRVPFLARRASGATWAGPQDAIQAAPAGRFQGSAELVCLGEVTGRFRGPLEERCSDEKPV